jgi:hypothetical protein
VAGRYTFPKPADQNARGGLEQSVWDPVTGLFYISVPGVTDSKVVTPGKIDVFGPRPGAPVASIPTPGCVNGPVGLTLVSGQRLIGACGNGAVTVDAFTGHVRGMIPGLDGSDEIAFDPGNGKLYASFPESATSTMWDLGVANVRTGKFLGDIPAGTVAHSVAVDACDGHIFVPVVGKGIDVFVSKQVIRSTSMTLNGLSSRDPGGRLRPCASRPCGPCRSPSSGSCRRRGRSAGS